MHELEALEEEQKLLSGQIGEAKNAGADISHLVQQHRELGSRLKRLRAEQADTDQANRRLETEIITDAAVFGDMQSEWNDLVERSDCYSPFLLWEWLYPWWEVFGEDKELFLVTARRGDRLEGIAPLMLGLRRGRKIDRRTLAFIGTGERAEGDYFDFIVSKEGSKQVRNALWATIVAQTERYDRTQLLNMAIEDEGVLNLVQIATANGARVLVTPRRSAVVGSLPASFEEFVQTVPSRERRNCLRHEDGRLRSRFETVEYCVAENEHELARVLCAIERFSLERLQVHSAWAGEMFRRCVHSASRLLLEQGRVRAETLAVDGKIVSARLGFVQGDTYFGYQMAFDEAYADCGAGHCLLGECLRSSIGAGLKRFDFLGGARDYKQSYSSLRKRLGDLTVFEPNVAGLRRAGTRLLAEAGKLYVKRLLGKASSG